MLSPETLIDFNIVEILLITTMAFLGSFFHRLWSFVFHRKPITLNTWMAILCNMIIVAIICLSLDPFVAAVHPRLVLLPPLLMGLVGEELINLLIHLDSSLGIIDWALNYFGIRKKDFHDPKLPDITPQEQTHQKYQELLENIIDVINKIEEGLQEYEEVKDDKIILQCSRDISKDISMIELKYNSCTDMDKTISKKYNEMMEVNAILTDLKKNYYKKNLNQDN